MTLVSASLSGARHVGRQGEGQSWGVNSVSGPLLKKIRITLRWLPRRVELPASEVLAAANQLVHGLRALGLERGGTIAVLLPNGAEFIELYLAVAQAGWYLVPINHHLVGPEIAYIVNDSGAEVFISHERFAEAATAAATEISVAEDHRFAIGSIPGFRPYAELTDGQSSEMPADRAAGNVMNYTSGTTGRPKGVRRALPTAPRGHRDDGRGHAHAVWAATPRQQRSYRGLALLSHGGAGFLPAAPSISGTAW